MTNDKSRLQKVKLIKIRKVDLIWWDMWEYIVIKSLSPPYVCILMVDRSSKIQSRLFHNNVSSISSSTEKLWKIRSWLSWLEKYEDSRIKAIIVK